VNHATRQEDPKCEQLERNEIPLQLITRRKESGSANQLQLSRPPGPEAKLHVYQRQPNWIEEKCCQEGRVLTRPSRLSALHKPMKNGSQAANQRFFELPEKMLIY
jgi:hypothetical protein